MRSLAILLILAGLPCTALAAKRITVAQLEQTLTAAHSLQDAEVALQLSDLELTERLSTTNLDRLETGLPGEKSRQALMILADASAFLAPPAAEIPDQAAPDPATLRSILARTVNYVTQTLHQLPNFFADRVTRSFEDTPAVKMEIGFGDINPNAAYRAIHLVGDSKVTVSFHDGREVLEKTKLDPLVRNLETAGVFADPRHSAGGFGAQHSQVGPLGKRPDWSPGGFHVSSTQRKVALHDFVRIRSDRTGALQHHSSNVQQDSRLSRRDGSRCSQRNRSSTHVDGRPEAGRIRPLQV